MKKLLKEFKDFALTGNIMDLAVAVILGAAISKMVSALVDNVIMPLIGILIGGADFSSLAITIGDASIKYGMFIQAVIEFFIIAMCIFLMIKGLATLDKKRKAILHQEEQEKKEEKKETSEELLAEIRDLLKQQEKR